MTHEEVPLASIFREVLRFLAARSDAVLFGAQAVNAYCETERMTHDIDVLSTNASELAAAVRDHLANRLHIAIRIREAGEDRAFRVYQVRKPRNRHLVDVRQVDALPDHAEIEGVRVVLPEALVAMKVMSLSARRNRPKGDTDRADIRRLLLAFPTLKVEGGQVARWLRDLGATEFMLSVWAELAGEPIEPDEDDEY